MPAAIGAAIAPFEMVFFGEHHQAFFVVIKINPLLQRHVRWFLILPVIARLMGATHERAK